MFEKLLFVFNLDETLTDILSENIQKNVSVGASPNECELVVPIGEADMDTGIQTATEYSSICSTSDITDSAPSDGNIDKKGWPAFDNMNRKSRCLCL